MKQLLFIFCCFTTLNVFAQPGTLDYSFGDSGIVISEETQGASIGSALQQDGKIILIGNGIIVRYNNDGSLDDSFGNNGIAADPYGSPLRVALQNTGKILVTTNVHGNGFDVQTTRYNQDGTIDSLFGLNGSIIINFTNDDIISAIAVQPDDKILILVRIDNRENEDPTYMLLRYFPDGALDKSFGDNGQKKMVYDGQLAFIYSMALQQNGKILTAGADWYSSFFVDRYLSNGQVDSSFGSNGRATVGITSEYNVANDIAVGSDGKIVVGGEMQAPLNLWENMIVIRFTENGALDYSFGGKGYVTSTFGDDTGSVTKAVLVQPDGKIITTGTKFNFLSPRFSYFTIIRFNTDGTYDTSFGIKGIQTTSLGNIDDVSGALLQDDGKIIVTGNTNTGVGNGITHFALARYLAGRQAKFVRIKHWLHRHGITWEDCPHWLCNNLNYYKVERSANGNSFTEIARIFKHNNQQQQNSYEDAAPLSGTNYYRLAAVSTDGGTTYSNVVAVEDDVALIKLYPNPVNNILHIEGLSATQRTKLTITDFMGNIKASTTITTTTYNWNIAQLKQGNYLLRIETNVSKITSKKFVKE